MKTTIFALALLSTAGSHSAASNDCTEESLTKLTNEYIAKNDQLVTQLTHIVRQEALTMETTAEGRDQLLNLAIERRRIQSELSERTEFYIHWASGVCKPE